MPDSFALLLRLRSAGVAAFISGAGPSVLTLHMGGELEIAELALIAGTGFEAKSLEIAPAGVVVSIA